MPLGVGPLGTTPLGADGGQPVKFALSGQSGSFQLTGSAAKTSAGRRLNDGVGAFTVTGAASRLAHGYVLAGGTGAFTLTGSPGNLDAPGRHLNGATGAIQLTGESAKTGAQRQSPEQTGHITLSGSGVSAAQRRSPEGTGEFHVSSPGATMGGRARPTTPVALLLAAAIDGNATCIGYYTVPPTDVFDLGYEGVIAIGISIEATATAQP